MVIYNLVLITNLCMIFTCKWQNCTKENSRDDSWPMYTQMNKAKYVYTGILAVLMKIRMVASNTLDLWTLFEMVALLMVIMREQGKSLGKLLFEANECDKSAKKFRNQEKKSIMVAYLVLLLAVILPNVFGIYP